MKIEVRKTQQNKSPVFRIEGTDADNRMVVFLSSGLGIVIAAKQNHQAIKERFQDLVGSLANLFLYPVASECQGFYSPLDWSTINLHASFWFFTRSVFLGIGV